MGVPTRIASQGGICQCEPRGPWHWGHGGVLVHAYTPLSWSQNHSLVPSDRRRPSGVQARASTSNTAVFARQCDIVTGAIVRKPEFLRTGFALKIKFNKLSREISRGQRSKPPNKQTVRDENRQLPLPHLFKDEGGK